MVTITRYILTLRISGITLIPCFYLFLNELSGCGFESRCSHLNFRFRVCFEQGHLGNYRVWIHSETRT